MRLFSVGEILWDIFEDKECLGGASLNFSVSAHRLGNPVALLSAVGTDPRGFRALEAMQTYGLVTDFIQIARHSPTGTASVSTGGAGNARFVIERPAAFDTVEVDDQVLLRIDQWRPEWIYFGTLAHSMPSGEERLNRILAATPTARRFYDINLRDGHWDFDLVQRLSRAATVLKLNESEASLLFEQTQKAHTFALEDFCSYWSATFGVNTICVTLGDKGCAIFEGNALQVFPGYPIKAVDTVGAGDAFAAGFLHGFNQGWRLERIAAFANSLGATVASRPGAIPPWTLADLEAITSAASGA